MEPITLNLRTATRLVVIENEEGKTSEFELREMKAAARDEYLTQLSNRFRLSPTSGEPVGMKNFDGAQAALLVRTLFDKFKGTYVTIDQVQKWPATVVTQLFKAAQQINSLDQTDEEKASKNN